MSVCFSLSVNDLSSSIVRRLRRFFGKLLYALLTTDVGVVIIPRLQLPVKEQSFPCTIFFHGLPTIVPNCCAVPGSDDVSA